MGRQIEVPDVNVAPKSMTIEVGDLLMFGGTGGHVKSGSAVLEMLGAFLPGLVTENGKILSPAGFPTSVMFLARHPGQVLVDVVTGDPFRAPQTTQFQIIVTPVTRE
jgi:hypothetical protein